MENKKYEEEIIKLGLLLKELREKERLTQLQLAILCNVDVRSIQRIEKGQQNITIILLFSISESLKIDPSVLIEKIFFKDK